MQSLLESPLHDAPAPTLSPVRQESWPSLEARKLSLHYSGIHRQEDRDARTAAKVVGAEKKIWHMMRVRVPLGTLSPDQYLVLDRLGERFTYNRSLRFTTGQSVQLHGLAERDLQVVIDQLAEIGLAAGCHASGYEFAIALSPLPVETSSYVRMRALASELCDELYPQPGFPVRNHPAHPPRKFTVGLAIPEDNSANVFANDVGLLLVEKPGAGSKINVFAGGSLSMPGRRPDTYARLATPLGSVDAVHALAVVQGIAKVFARHGRLATRRHTRLKYVVDQLGLERFRAEVEAATGLRFSAPAPVGPLSIPSWQGTRDLRNGTFSYGLNLPNGRIQDAGMLRYKTALRLIVETFRPQVVVGPDQNVILTGLRLEQIEQLERVLAAYHIPSAGAISKVRFTAMACAGLPTCPVAVAESERVAPRLLDELEEELVRLGRAESEFTFRISGCSIGCIRPNMVDLGVVGRKPGRYDLFVGGSEATGRFGELFEENVPLEEIIPTIRPLLEFWAGHAAPGEKFHEFYGTRFASNLGAARLVACQEAPARAWIEKEINPA